MCLFVVTIIVMIVRSCEPSLRYHTLPYHEKADGLEKDKTMFLLFAFDSFALVLLLFSYNFLPSLF